MAGSRFHRERRRKREPGYRRGLPVFVEFPLRRAWRRRSSPKPMTMLDFRRLWRKSNRAPRFMVEPQHTLPKARMIQGIDRLPFSAKEGKMRFGESFGEACRYCGCTQIIVSPPSSAGHCAQCSKEALAWDCLL